MLTRRVSRRELLVQLVRNSTLVGAAVVIHPLLNAFQGEQVADNSQLTPPNELIERVQKETVYRIKKDINQPLLDKWNVIYGPEAVFYKCGVHHYDFDSIYRREIVIPPYSISQTGEAVLIMEGKTVEPKETAGAKKQIVDYVVGIQSQGKIEPVSYGRIEALVLEFYQGTPSGKILNHKQMKVQ